jgi:hypothetical protein
VNDGVFRALFFFFHGKGAQKDEFKKRRNISWKSDCYADCKRDNLGMSAIVLAEEGPLASTTTSVLLSAFFE